MSLKTYHLLLSKIPAAQHQLLLNDSDILKSESIMQHGAAVVDIQIGSRTLFDIALERGATPNSATAVIIREDHPLFAWVMLNSQ